MHSLLLVPASQESYTPTFDPGFLQQINNANKDDGRINYNGHT